MYYVFNTKQLFPTKIIRKMLCSAIFCNILYIMRAIHEEVVAYFINHKSQLHFPCARLHFPYLKESNKRLTNYFNN